MLRVITTPMDWTTFYADQSEASSTRFLGSLIKAAPMKIARILTDNGSQFMDRFTSRTKAPPGKHLFDRECTTLGIEHRLAPPRHPQTNGMVERFNGRIAEVVRQTRFKSAAELSRPSRTTRQLTTTAYPSVRSTTCRPFKPCRNGKETAPNCSSNGSITRRDSTANLLME